MNTYSFPSRPTRGEAIASSPTMSGTSTGAAGSHAVRSAIQMSSRGAVPTDAEMISQRPSLLTLAP